MTEMIGLAAIGVLPGKLINTSGVSEIRSPGGRKKVVLLGDSIRMRYQPVVRKLLGDGYEVWGPDVNCRHSLWVLEHFTEWVEDQKPDILHFNFGLHDIDTRWTANPKKGWENDGRPQIILDQYRLGLSRFLSMAGRLGIKTLIWATTTPLLPGDKRNMMLDEYNAAALEIVNRQNVHVNDLHKVIADHDCTKLIDDGVHMTAAGNELLANAVAGKISELAGK